MELEMNLQQASEHIPPLQDSLIKVSGLVGGSTAFAGLAIDLSAYSEVSQILANIGIFIGALTAFFTFIYTVYRGSKKKKDV